MLYPGLRQGGYSYDANGNHKRYETAQNNGYTADNMVIDTNEDKILEKTNKDGTRTGYSYDPMGNLTTKVVYAAGASFLYPIHRKNPVVSWFKTSAANKQKRDSNPA
jgi:YD repeat-containing protein